MINLRQKLLEEGGIKIGDLLEIKLVAHAIYDDGYRGLFKYNEKRGWIGKETIQSAEPGNNVSGYFQGLENEESIIMDNYTKVSVHSKSPFGNWRIKKEAIYSYRIIPHQTLAIVTDKAVREESAAQQHI